MGLGQAENVKFLIELLPILLYSALCGGIIGFERARRGSPAGMKTQVFICVGSALYTVCSTHISQLHGGDPGRLIAQIVSGVGFLGAGTIMARDRVIGLTTAAIIWVMAGIGIMIGLGYGPATVVVTIGMFISIKLISAIETRFVPTHAHQRRSTDEGQIEESNVNPFERLVKNKSDTSGSEDKSKDKRNVG